jgi:hypothetical protein
VLQLVVDLLLTNKEPLTSFASIKNADVKDLIVDNEGNLDTWRNVRKQIQGLNLSEAVKTILGMVCLNVFMPGSTLLLEYFI